MGITLTTDGIRSSILLKTLIWKQNLRPAVNLKILRARKFAWMMMIKSRSLKCTGPRSVSYSWLNKSQSMREDITFVTSLIGWDLVQPKVEKGRALEWSKYASCVYSFLTSAISEVTGHQECNSSGKPGPICITIAEFQISVSLNPDGPRIGM